MMALVDVVRVVHILYPIPLIALVNIVKVAPWLKVAPGLKASSVASRQALIPHHTSSPSSSTSFSLFRTCLDHNKRITIVIQIPREPVSFPF